MNDGADRIQHEPAWIGRVIAHDDHQAFAQLVRLHQTAVRLFLRRLTGNDWSRAEDLAQETFWKAYRHLGSFQARGRFLSWLFRIAYQLFITEQRSARGVTHVPLAKEMPAGENATQRIDASRTFDQMMNTLAPDERAAIVLHYRHELTHPEMAEILDLPLGTVKSLIRRAHFKLREAHDPGHAGRDR